MNVRSKNMGQEDRENSHTSFFDDRRSGSEESSPLIERRKGQFASNSEWYLQVPTLASGKS